MILYNDAKIVYNFVDTNVRVISVPKTNPLGIRPPRGFYFFILQGDLNLEADCLLLSVQPFTDIMRHYTCRDGNHKCEGNFHRHHLLSVPSN